MRIKARKPNVAAVDMTPMIDIVFQLIAFFMVISNFEQTEADERVKLPKDALARPPEVAREHEFVLNIGYKRNREGQRIDPNPLVFFADVEIPVLEMGPVLDRERQLYVELGTDPKDVTVVIRADGEVPTGLVQQIVKMAQESTFEKFSLKALQKGEP